MSLAQDEVLATDPSAPPAFHDKLLGPPGPWSLDRDESYVFDQYWPIPTYLFSTGVTTAVVQSFLIYRFWSLTRQWIISGILGLGMLTSAAGVIATAAAQIMYPQYTERYKGRVYVTVWLIASAACDVCIAVSLTFQLRKMKPTFQESKRVINRLIGSVISTGTASTIVAIRDSDSFSPESYDQRFDRGRILLGSPLFAYNGVLSITGYVFAPS
ncbi:hypothetical protein IW262DRAFT_1547872 [Armillaria fumosa]|nr:hypothetical protein IW262DRAFT_1547872 [Armillaria fumosa]